jgi:hypothetical protein
MSGSNVGRLISSKFRTGSHGERSSRISQTLPLFTADCSPVSGLDSSRILRRSVYEALKMTRA